LKNVFGLVVAVCLGLAFSGTSRAEDARALKLNQDSIGLLTSQVALLPSALQISKAIDHTDGLRILPIVGRGGLQTINDLLFLRPVDIAMLSSDALAFVRKNGLYTDEELKISYLAKIGNANVIILARPEFTTLQSLSGKRVAVGSSETSGFIAADLIFGDIGLRYESVGMTGSSALAGMKNGTIDAAVFAGAESYPDLAEIDATSGFHIVPISVNGKLAQTYSPAILASTDFPNLISSDKVVETVASALVLAVYDWRNRSERFYKLRKFKTALFANYSKTTNQEHATNFSATVPGWKLYDTIEKPRVRQSRKAIAITALQEEDTR
jgi:uncharacterized protein